MTREEGCLLWLTLVQGLGNRGIEKLLSSFGSAQDVYDAGYGAWAQVVGEGLAARMRERQDPERINAYFKRVRQMGGDILTRAHPLYPKALAETPDAPYTLYALGDLSLLQGELVAVIGSRNMSRDGERAAALFGAGLARAGVTVVSGLARGADGTAQKAALDAGGRSIGVLGCGLDVFYPPENEALQRRLAREGLLLSECPPGTPARGWQFSARNRIIAGLSRGVVVVEAGEKSGALVTAGYAVDYDRELFAVPGSIFLPQSAGSNQLLRFSALPALGPEDVLNTLGLGTKAAPGPKAEPLPEGLNAEERALCQILRRGECSFDDLVEFSSMEPGKLNSLLTMLEMRGIIIKTPGRFYALSGGA